MTLADKVISLAKSQVGTHEGYSNGHWNNDQKYSKEVPGLEWSNYQAWCATFVYWCAYKSGAGDLYPKTASCLNAVGFYKNEGRFSEYPAVGAQIFFGPGGGSHTGVVVDFDSTYVYTVEGNTNTDGSSEGDGVYAKTHERRSDRVYGYGYPKFAEGIKSADPAYADATPKPIPTPKPAPKPIPKPTPIYATYPGASFFRFGKKSPLIAAMHARLVAEGCNRYRSSLGKEIWGSGDKASYAAWQRKCGYSGSAADGIPGKSSWDKLRVPKP